MTDDQSVIEIDYRGAEFSPCQRFRYRLWRYWAQPLGESMVMFLMLNPSTATATDDDPTVRRCIGYAKDWGYGGLYVGNLFPFRSPSPAELKRANDRTGDTGKAAVALYEMAQQSEKVVLGWGAHAEQYPWQVERVLDQLPAATYLYCLKQLEGSGQPAHPLYLSKDLQPMPFQRRRSLL